jgi:CheY-like chemotaxis protein
VTGTAPGNARPRRSFDVVLADDDPEMRALVRDALGESDRFRVVGEARDGGEAVAQAARHRPDLLLLDLSMPVMSGLEALAPIREASPETQVVVLSHFPERRLGSLLLARGAVGYLEKRGSLVDLPSRLLAIAGLLELANDVLQEGGAELAADSGGPRHARRFIEELLRDWDCEESLDAVRLLVSEVVANAVVHAGSDVKVAVQLRADAVRVAVTDHDPTMPTMRSPDVTEESGRGLALVDALSSAWGIDSIPGGKHVWFEVPRFDRPTAASA